MNSKLGWVALLLSLQACGGGEAMGLDGGVDAAPADSGPRADAGLLAETLFGDLGGTSEGIAMVTLGGEDALVVTRGIGSDLVLRVAPDGTTTTFATVPGGLAMAQLADGALLVCGRTLSDSSAPGAVWRVETDGSASILISADPAGGDIGQANALAIAPDESFFVFTDSELDRVYRASIDGSGLALVTDALDFPNGVAFSADGSAVFVAEWNGAAVHRFAVSSGELGAPEEVVTGIPNPDGVLVAPDGALLVVSSIRGVWRAVPGEAATQLARGPMLGANAALGRGAYGEGTLYVASLARTQLTRLDLGGRVSGF